MSNITMSDVVEYFNAYKAKYEEECTLPLDAIEEIMEEASDTDAMIAAMYEAQHTDDETEDDRSEPVSVVEDTSEGSAFAYAARMDDTIGEHLDTLSKAALENKRGAAVIMDDLFRIYGKETVCDVWPVPGTKADKGRMTGNRLAAKYATTVRKEDGTTAEGTVDWYSELVRYSKKGKEIEAIKASLKGISADEKGPHILADHEYLRGDKVRIVAAKAAIDGKFNNAKASIVRAVQLAQKMAFYNKYTTMGCEISREEDGQPVASNKLVYIFNTEDRSKFNVLSIGQLLALKNMEEGAKYSAIVGSTTRQRKVETAPKVDYTINNLDTFDAEIAAVATFFDKLEEATNRKDMKVYNQLLTRLNAEGSGDLLLSMNQIMNSIEVILSKPTYADRLAKLLAQGKKQAA